MFHEFGTCLMTHAAISATCAFPTAGSTLTSLCELERRGVRRPLKRVGRVVLPAAPLLVCGVPYMCWTSLRGIARCRRHNPNHRAHMAVSMRNCPRCVVRYIVTGRCGTSLWQATTLKHATLKQRCQAAHGLVKISLPNHCRWRHGS